MTLISEILLPRQINLALTAETQSEGVAEVLDKLNGDPRVTDWTRLAASISERNAPAIESGDCGICIAHGRTNAVATLVMAAGRSNVGIASPEIQGPVRLIFVAGIPAAFSSDYLRVVGAIARLCGDKALLADLLATDDPQRFVSLLDAASARL